MPKTRTTTSAHKQTTANSWKRATSSIDVGAASKKPKIAINNDDMDESKVENEGEGKWKKKGKDGKDKGKKAKNPR